MKKIKYVGHICHGVIKDKCYAPEYSYGEICVGCNCCGRVNRKTMLKARIKFHKEMIKQNKEFNLWGSTADMVELQKKNIELNIKWHTKKLKYLKDKYDVRER